MLGWAMTLLACAVIGTCQSPLAIVYGYTHILTWCGDPFAAYLFVFGFVRASPLGELLHGFFSFRALSSFFEGEDGDPVVMLDTHTYHRGLLAM